MEAFIEKYFLYLYANDKCHQSEYGSIGKEPGCIDKKYRIIANDMQIKIVPACIRTIKIDFFEMYIHPQFLIPDEHMRCGDLGIWIFSDKESNMTLLQQTILPKSTCVMF